MLPKIGPIRVRRLLNELGSPERVLAAPIHRLEQVAGVGTESAQIIHHWENHCDIQKEISECETRGIRIITAASDEYPESLRHIYDPPLLLYVWGKLIPADQHAIAIVGSRRSTHYGQQATRDIASHLTRTGHTIISGLARGIDTHAHRAAIDAGGRTIAVIGSGLGQIYPPENMNLAHEIASGHGAVISEFPVHKRPNKMTFPRRNRIVAACSKGILVTECPSWSGSLITAQLGLEMGKNIYAVPGPIDRPHSSGCNQLIRDGATLVRSADDIIEDFEALPLIGKLHAQPQATPDPSLSEEESSIYAAIQLQDQSIDSLVDRTRLPIATIISQLLQLEMKRLVTQLPGPRYTLRK
ncbi:DNA-processing protein DprA [Rubritalea marina]|uniref:DNA-processing protein DprA n=1 Tax=Rubritalea marina TaxID=361055 RepID=UPI001461683A|nr:DNA-processing protein DprA [Rubritalea marina]